MLGALQYASVASVAQAFIGGKCRCVDRDLSTHVLGVCWLASRDPTLISLFELLQQVRGLVAGLTPGMGTTLNLAWTAEEFKSARQIKRVGNDCVQWVVAEGVAEDLALKWHAEDPP